MVDHRGNAAEIATTGSKGALEGGREGITRRLFTMNGLTRFGVGTELAGHGIGILETAAISKKGIFKTAAGTLG